MKNAKESKQDTCVFTNVHLFTLHAETGLYLYFQLTDSWAGCIYYGIIIVYYVIVYCKSKQNKRARAVI